MGMTTSAVDFALDRDAEVPIGVQLAWALRTRIGDGRFRPGQRLPGLRELAEAVGVNANTVRAVYQRLEHEGLIDSQQGSGTFVAAGARQRSAVGTIAAGAAREAQESGVDPREVAAALYVAPEAAPQTTAPETPGEASERRRQLRAQITALGRMLGELEAKHPRLAPRPTPASAQAGPRLLSTEDLEEVQSQMIRRLAALQAAIDGVAHEESEDAEARPRASARKKTKPETTGGSRAKAQADMGGKRAGQPRAKTRPAPAGA